MTLDEFRSLKEGDKIEGMIGNVGTVSRVDESRNSRGRSVAIEWGHNVTPFSFNEHMTAWMHWTKIEPEGDKLAELAVDRMTQRREESVQSENDANGECTG